MINKDWHLMKEEEPSVVEEDEQFQYNYAIVLNTSYDCIGDYLCGGLCALNPQKRVFEFVYAAGKVMEIKFEDVIAWYKVPPFMRDDLGKATE